MFFNQHSRAVGTFSELEAAGQGLDQLVLGGFPLPKVFLFGADLSGYELNSKASEPVRLIDQAKAGAIAGTGLGLKQGLVAGNVLGGATGVLLGLGILALPGVGQIAMTSAFMFTLVSGGICTAAGGVIGALVGLGLTEKQVQAYNEQLSNGNYLLVVTGTDREIRCAERILTTQSIPN